MSAFWETDFCSVAKGNNHDLSDNASRFRLLKDTSCKEGDSIVFRRRLNLAMQGQSFLKEVVCDRIIAFYSVVVRRCATLRVRHQVELCSEADLGIDKSGDYSQPSN